MAFYEHSAKGHRVSVWWNVGTKNPELVASAVVDDYTLALYSWRIKLLENLDEDLQRRKSA